MRVTTGRFVASGKTFRHTDTWTNRTMAHRALEDYWVGTTEFYLVSSRAPSSSNNNYCRQDDHQHNHDNHNHQNEQRNSVAVHGNTTPPTGINGVEGAELNNLKKKERRERDRGRRAEGPEDGGEPWRL